MKHLKKRRKFELLIYDLKKVLGDPAVDDRYGVLFGLTYDVLSFVEDICRDPEKAAMLIDATRMARGALGEGRDCAEEKLMQTLDFAVHICMNAFDAAGFHSFLMFPSCDGCPDALDIQCRIMCDICTYAIDCFSYKKARDQFAGMRRARAFEILGSASWIFDIPDAIPLALGALKRNRRLEARGAIAFLEAYFKARKGKDAIPSKVVDGLLSVVDRTDNRANATGALNVLVEAGYMSEFEALDRLDDWKEEHLY